MGDHKKTHCKNGHPLAYPNLVFNKEGCRECRLCRYVRNNKYNKNKRRNK